MEELEAQDPRSIGGYRLIGRLGEGGMGRVYLARSDRGRTVAVKLVRDELTQQEEFRARFRQEVKAARRVGGVWTAPVLDADTEAATPWVATGYIAGPSLQKVIGVGHRPLPERSVRLLAAGLARALQAVHAAGIIHRDLKPSNVLITIDGPRVIDFGIARALETTVAGDGLTRTGSIVGTPGFLSPEQVRGDRLTPASDIFCLGSVLAYAATAHLPFGGANSAVHAILYRVAQEEPELSELPEGLRELVTSCLAKDPAERPTLEQVLERTGDPEGDASPLDDPDEPWLPGFLIAQLGRHATELLEAEHPRGDTGGRGAQLALPSAAPAAGAASPGESSGPDPTGAPPAQSPTGQPPAAQPQSVQTQPTQSPAAQSPAAQSPSPQPPSPPPPAAQPMLPPATTPAAAWPPAAPPTTAAARDLSTPPTLHGMPTEVGTQGPAPGVTPPPAPPASAGSYTPPVGYHPYPSPPEPARSRTGSAVVIAVLVTLLIVVSGVTAYALLGKGDDDNKDNAEQPGRNGQSPPGDDTDIDGATSSPSDSPSGSPSKGGDKVPSHMVGTWQRTFGTGGANVFQVHISQGEIGDTVVTVTGEGPTYRCEFEADLTSYGPPIGLSGSRVTYRSSEGACAPGPGTTLKLTGNGQLHRAFSDGRATEVYTRAN